ncbi:MFS transporter [Amycolatopsis sp. H6(2020)]|nr:MFS transporter [Amycolatopsis sp. H6(2020)]
MTTTRTRTERLDELPLTRKHARLLTGSGIGWALDAMDVGLISFIMAALTAQWGLTPTEASWLGSIGFIGMALGATLGGLLADRFGRRQIFATTLLVYGLATGASALSTGLAMLMALRFLVGLGLGAELPVASTLVSEFAPRRIRGRMVVLLEAFWAVGWLAAACIGAFVVGASPEGWRWALALGCLPAVYALIVRLGLPESVRFLESRGRHEEAERVVRSFEEAAEHSGKTGAAGAADGAGAAETTGRAAAGAASAADAGTRAGTADAADAAGASAGAAARTASPSGSAAARTTSDSAPEPSGGVGIWSTQLRGRTAALWTVWFCINLSYYGAFIWIPSLLHAQGFTLVKSFTFTLIITLAQLPGYAAAAWLIERWGRRITLAVFLAGSAAAAIGYGLSTSETAIIVCGCLLSFFNLGAWGALYAIGPELYPTTVRGAGTGAAAGFGRIASIIAPLIVPPLVALGGHVLLFGVFAAAFAVAAAAAFTLPEQRGRALTEG